MTKHLRTMVLTPCICLKCQQTFGSRDKKTNRICQRCTYRNDQLVISNGRMGISNFIPNKTYGTPLVGSEDGNPLYKD